MNTALDRAYRALRLEPGMSPLATRPPLRTGGRSGELRRGWHRDRHPDAPPPQGGARGKSKETNAPSGTIGLGGGQGRVPLRPPRPPPPRAPPPMPDLWKDTVGD